MKKLLERKLKLGGDAEGKLENQTELEYYLTEDEADSDFELAGLTIYGVYVAKKVNSLYVEEEVIRDFSSCPETTRQLIVKLAENSVTPVGLKYVVEDLIGV